MHGPACQWMPEIFTHGMAVAGALVGLLVAERLLRRGVAVLDVRRRRVVRFVLLLASLPLMWLLLEQGPGRWGEFLAGSSWYVRMGLAALAAVVIGCAVGGSCLYVFDLLDEPDFVRPEPGEVAGGRGAGRGVPPPTPMSARSAATVGPPTSAQEPTLRPAPGTVSSAPPGRDEGEERAGLLRTLAEGPDFRRGAAAAALALSCAGVRDLEVITALLAALRNEEYGGLVRAESLLALYALLGQSLPVEVEVVVRQDFPEGVDWEFVRSCEALVDAEG